MIIHIKQSLSYFSVVSDWHKSTIREDQNDNLQSSIFYNHITEQIEYYNAPHQKRIFHNGLWSAAPFNEWQALLRLS